MAIYRFRYCQRCSTQQTLSDLDEPRPCRHCGGSQFDVRPHAKRRIYSLNAADRVFLRVNRIDPQED